MNKNIPNDYILRRNKITNNTQTQKVNQNQNGTLPKTSFEQVLNRVKQTDEVNFSKHAIQRLESRNISLTNEDVKKINDAVNKADQKGIKDALILLNDKIFIANVKSKTIVTAAQEDQLKEHVFTKIDGAVII